MAHGTAGQPHQDPEPLLAPVPLRQPVTDSSTPILSAHNVTLKRGRRRIHENLTISFPTGVTALLGPNGAGKTTLIEGLLRPTHVGDGTVSLDGSEVPAELTEADFLARVGHMPQAWTFFGSFTVLESVEYVAWLKRIPSARISDAAHEALRATDMFEHRGTKIAKLSGGMRQRVGLAEAFVNDPRVILLDEPTVGLDPAQRASFRRYVAAKRRQGDRAEYPSHGGCRGGR